MALTWYTSSGQPSDTIGVAGDMTYDTTNKFFWGPKTSANTWAGTANNTLGPTGPAMLAGSGPPGTSYGQIGNGYTDTATGNLYLKSSSGWTQTGTLQVTNSLAVILQGAGPPNATTAPSVAVGQFYFDNVNILMYGPSTSASYLGLTSVFNMCGPTGPNGFTSLASQSAGNGPSVGMSGNSLSGSLSPAFVPGTSQPAAFYSSFATQLMGYTITNPGPAMTVALVNTTTGSTIISLSIAANVTTGASYALNAYPMPASQNYQWQVSGSGTAQFCLTPQYLMPSASAGNNISNLPTVGVSGSTTFSSTATQLKYPGTTVGNASRLIRGGAFYGATLSNLTTSSLTFTLNYSTNAGSSYATLYSVSVNANTTSTVGPFSSLQYATAVASHVYWSVSGTGTGTCFVDTQILYVG